MVVYHDAELVLLLSLFSFLVYMFLFFFLQFSLHVYFRSFFFFAETKNVIAVFFVIQSHVLTFPKYCGVNNDVSKFVSFENKLSAVEHRVSEPVSFESSIGLHRVGVTFHLVSTQWLNFGNSVLYVLRQLKKLFSQIFLGRLRLCLLLLSFIISFSNQFSNFH